MKKVILILALTIGASAGVICITTCGPDGQGCVTTCSD